MGLSIDYRVVQHDIRIVVREKKRDYVGKIPKLRGGSDPNPLLDVYLSSYFWHAKMILKHVLQKGGR